MSYGARPCERPLEALARERTRASAGELSDFGVPFLAPSMLVPSLSYLAELEDTFAWPVPKSFERFCRRYAQKSLLADYPNMVGTFVSDVATLRRLDALMCGRDVPRGDALEAELVPIYFEQTKRQKKKGGISDIYGFDPQSRDEKVYVWSVHCIVHGYDSFDAWLAVMANGSRT